MLDLLPLAAASLKLPLNDRNSAAIYRVLFAESGVNSGLHPASSEIADSLVLELMFRFTNIDEASINTVGQIWCTFAGALSEW